MIVDKIEALDILKKSKSGQQVKNFSPLLQDDTDIAKAAVTKNGRALQYFSEHMRNNPLIASLAIKKDAIAFKYIGAKILQNKEFILQHIDGHYSYSYFYQLCAPELQHNREFARDFLEKNAHAFKYMPESFQKDKALALTAIQATPFSYSRLKYFKDDPDIWQYAKNHASNIRYLPKYLKKNEATILSALASIAKNDNMSDLSFLEPSIKNSKSFWQKAIAHNPYLFRFAADHLKEDTELLSTLLGKFETIDATSKTHQEILMPFLKKNIYYFYFAPEGMKNDKYLMLEILQKDNRAIRFVGEELKNMIGFDSSQCVSNLERLIEIEKRHANLEDMLEKKDGHVRKNKI